MKRFALSLMAFFVLAAPALAGGFTYENRPAVVFKGGVERMTPYPQSKRSTSVWVSDACWRDCKSSCTWKMEYCVRASDPDLCRPGLDACDRSCQRTCRGFSGGPLLGFIDF